jgi:hypothetical protein
MDNETKELLKEAYHYGWAHAIEESEKQIRLLKSPSSNPEIVELFDSIVSGICDTLKSHADKTKNK